MHRDRDNSPVAPLPERLDHQRGHDPARDGEVPVVLEGADQVPADPLDVALNLMNARATDQGDNL